MALIDTLQSWGKCPECRDILWCEVSIHEQRCGCFCGGLILHDDEAIGKTDESFTSDDMEGILLLEAIE